MAVGASADSSENGAIKVDADATGADADATGADAKATGAMDLNMSASASSRVGAIQN